jgi:hypothetical protein
LQYYLLSFLAAFIACLCCSLPLLALALGLAGASGIKGYMGKYHDLYQFAAVSILLGACVFMWLQKKKGRMSLKGDGRQYELPLGDSLLRYPKSALGATVKRI